MYDGMVRKIICRCVANCQKNLICLGTLAKHRLRYSYEDDMLKVCKCGLVVMKGDMHLAIFSVESCIFRGMIDVFQSLEQHDENKELYHQILGYMGEKILSISSIKRLVGEGLVGEVKFYEACVKGKYR